MEKRHDECFFSAPFYQEARTILSFAPFCHSRHWLLLVGSGAFAPSKFILKSCLCTMIKNKSLYLRHLQSFYLCHLPTTDSTDALFDAERSGCLFCVARFLASFVCLSAVRFRNAPQTTIIPDTRDGQGRPMDGRKQRRRQQWHEHRRRRQQQQPKATSRETTAMPSSAMAAVGAD